MAQQSKALSEQTSRSKSNEYENEAGEHTTEMKKLNLYAKVSATKPDISKGSR